MEEPIRVHQKNEMGEIVGPSGNTVSSLAGCFQIGVRYCVSRSEAKEGHVLSSQLARDPGPPFQEVQKVFFDREGSATTVPHPYTSFSFKEHMPSVFRRLRRSFRCDTANFLVSLCNPLPDGSNALRVMGTPGKSGSLFFFSADMNYVVKTISEQEVAMIEQIMPRYSDYIEKHPESLLPRFYGLYVLRPDFGRPTRFIVTNNVFASRHEVHLRYDLKGSTLGRRAALSKGTDVGGTPVVLKDLDLLQNNERIRIGWQAKAKLMEQIQLDSAFLAEGNMMDYSLLLGVHLRGTKSPEKGAPDFLVLLCISAVCCVTVSWLCDSLLWCRLAVV